MAKLWNNIWFRCITVLLCIVIVLGGLLAILNDVLAVSDETRTQRAIKKIYGEDKSNIVTLLDIDGDDEPFYHVKGDGSTYGEIQKIYQIDKVENSENYDILFKSKGEKGYHGGSITLWVKVSFTKDSNPEITKVLVEDYDKQTLMSKLGGDFYDEFLIDVTDSYFTAKAWGDLKTNTVTGATYSADAACNAVNAVIYYVREVLA